MFEESQECEPQAPIQLSSDMLPEDWRELLADEFEQPYMQSLQDFLTSEQNHGKIIYPAANHIFTAFNLTPLYKVKVVILGQDPYHGPDQAMGLSFSVPKALKKLPPSLKNIYKELNADLGIPVPTSGDLTSWAKQGVLLLNATLTVEASKAGAHQKLGWEAFTDKVIQVLNEQCEGLVFILWGSYAQKKGTIINSERHCVLKSAHPSPLSAHRGFFGSSPFSHINQYLSRNSQAEIDWLI